MFLRLYPTKKLLYLPIEAHHLDKITSRLRVTSNKAETTRTKMTLSPKSLAGPGYIILNVIRAMNCIAFLAVIVASILMLVKTTTTSSFFFFDAVTHVLTAITSMFLLASEFSLFQSYYARNWPLLSPAHGFVTLALAMLVLGINMLGNLNKDATSQKALGMPFWRILIASGILIFILSWVNLIASFVFRDRARGLTARQVRADGAVAVHKSPIPGCGTPPAPELAQSYLPNPISPSKSGSPFREWKSQRPQSVRSYTLPSYHTAPSLTASPTYTAKEPISPTSRYSRVTACTKKKVYGFMGRNRDSLAPPLPVNTQNRPMEISAPMGINPQFAHLVQRPDSALHPSRTGDSQAFRWKSNA